MLSPLEEDKMSGDIFYLKSYLAYITGNVPTAQLMHCFHFNHGSNEGRNPQIAIWNLIKPIKYYYIFIFTFKNKLFLFPTISFNF